MQFSCNKAINPSCFFTCSTSNALNMFFIETANGLSSCLSNEKYAETKNVESDGQLVEVAPSDAKVSLPIEEAKYYKYRFTSILQISDVALEPTVLAQAGFYYVGSRNVFQCYSCQTCVKNWTKSDDPFSKKWHSVHCQHINRTGIETLSKLSLEETDINLVKDSADADAQISSLSKITALPSKARRKPTSPASTKRMKIETAPRLSQNKLLSLSNVPTDETLFQSKECQSSSPLDLPATSQKNMQSSLITQLQSLKTANPPPNLVSKQSRTLQPLEASQSIISATCEDIPASNEPLISQTMQSTSDICFEDNKSLVPTTPETLLGLQEEDMPESELDVKDDFLSETERASCRSLYKCQNPFSIEMVRLSRRVASFQSAHLDCSNFNAAQLALAGFYYLGFSDHVQCWYCGVEASGWTSDKNPWAEHARLFPSCEFLLRNCGINFVEAALLQFTSSRQASVGEPEYPELNFPYYLDDSTERIQSGPERLSTPPIEDLFLTETQQRNLLDESMESEFVLTAIQLNFSRSHIRRVIKRQISQHLCNFQSIEALIDALVTTPAEELTFQPAIEPRNEITNSGEERNENNASTSQESERSTTIERPVLQSRSSRAEEAAEEVLERIHSEQRCKVCLDSKACILFRPCAHICVCTDCARQLSSCPICRRRIQSSMIVTRP